MSSRWAVAMTLAAAIVALPLTAAAAAQKTDAPKGRADAHAQAVELSQESRAAYREGRFKDAVELLRQAYAVEPSPTLLYNLGRAYEGLGELAQALDAYQRYLAETPEAKDRGAMEERVRTLTRQIAEREKLQREGERRTEARAQPNVEPRRPSPIPWIVAGVGVASVGAGVVFGLVARRANDDADNARAQTEVDEKRNQAQTWATVANVCFVAGGVVAAGGIVWGVVNVSATQDRSSAKSAALRIGPATVAFEGRF